MILSHAVLASCNLTIYAIDLASSEWMLTAPTILICLNFLLFVFLTNKPEPFVVFLAASWTFINFDTGLTKYCTVARITTHDCALNRRETDDALKSLRIH